MYSVLVILSSEIMIYVNQMLFVVEIQNVVGLTGIYFQGNLGMSTRTSKQDS